MQYTYVYVYVDKAKGALGPLYCPLPILDTWVINAWPCDWPHFGTRTRLINNVNQSLLRTSFHAFVGEKCNAARNVSDWAELEHR